MRKNKTVSLHSELLKWIVFILLISLCLFLALVTTVIFSRIERNTQNLLDRSLAIGWQKYNQFFIQENSFLEALAAGEDARALFQSQDHYSETIETMKMMQEKKKHDFWVIIDSNGAVLATNMVPGKEYPDDLIQFAENILKRGETVSTSEVFTESEINVFPPELVRKTRVALVEESSQNSKQYHPYTLVQIAGVPVKDKSNSTIGCLIGGQIVNNNTSIPNAYSATVPDSFLSIGVRGIRVSANIKGEQTANFIGMRQSSKLVETTEKGERYNGNTQIDSNEIHLVTAEPILNFKGEAVGVLTVGVPSQGLSTIQRDTFYSLILYVLLTFVIALIMVSIVTRKLSLPISDLSMMAREISDSKSISDEHVTKLGKIEESRITEINHLRNCFLNMTINLYHKGKEIDAYLEQSKQDRFALQLLTEELQEANSELELKVKKRTEELENAVQELQTLNHLKTQFLANTSHELRTPLHSIIGFSEMLYDGLYGEMNKIQKDYVAIILDSAKQLLQIIGDILDISSIESQKTTLDKQKIDLKDIINSMVTIIRPIAEERGLELIIKIPEDIPSVLADPIRIKQVLSNLLSNAVKFTPEGGTITVEAFRNADEVGVSVADTGIGIKEEHQQNIFNEFYQCEDPYKRLFEGVGLGLPLSKKLIELHNGRIQLESTYGVGTKISFYLPLKEEIS
ncbi:MAG: ATP-binding protein [Syntrophaceticus sp.]